MVKPCQHRIATDKENFFECSNSKDLVIAGLVSAEFCAICPYSMPYATGFFAQTQQLLVQKARRGEITVAAKPCGGCKETKHRIPNGPVTQFVWPYWDGGANGDELRWSIRSVEKFFQGRAKITIIGDRPSWYHGHCIIKKRVPNNKPHRAFRDMLSKVWYIATHAEIDNECVWMMDDIYFLKPFTLDDIKIPRATPWRKSVGNSWQKRKTSSMAALEEKGFTQHDYATHMPHWLEKQKLKTMFNEFDLHNNTMLWEVLYGNIYRESPQKLSPFFVRLKNNGPKEFFVEKTAQATVMNHIASAWCDGLRQFLSDLLPEPSESEGKNALAKPAPYIRKQKPKRKVKRRPIETHKAYAQKNVELSKVKLPHIMIIQSAYSDERLSRSRLDIAMHTSIPSLAFQTSKPVVHIAVNPSDPYLEERLRAFRSTGCEIKPLYRSEWKLYKENWELPEGRKIVSRMDDDDVIAKDYCKELQDAAPESGEWNLAFPTGYVWWRSTAYRLEHIGIQFVTLVTDHQTDPHQEGHWTYHKTWQTKIVNSNPSWIWVRHNDSATPTLKKYRGKKLKGIDAKRVPINLRAIDRVIIPLGQPSGTYDEHKNKDILNSVLVENNKNAGTAIPKGFGE